MDTPATPQSWLDSTLLTAQVLNALYGAADLCTQSGLPVSLTLERVQPMSVLCVAVYAQQGPRHYLFVLLTEDGGQARLVRLDAQGNDAMALYDDIDHSFAAAIGQTLAPTVGALYARLVPLSAQATHAPPETLQ